MQLKHESEIRNLPEFGYYSCPKCGTSTDGNKKTYTELQYFSDTGYQVGPVLFTSDETHFRGVMLWTCDKCQYTRYTQCLDEDK